jgi:SAM-dependent methyltransferase/nitrogen fixation protein FixH
MADQPISSSGIRRSAVYSYLRPVIVGRRVLEIGCGTGESAAHLVRLGAKSVTGVGSAQEVSAARARFHEGALGFVAVESGSYDAAGAFDLVLVPEATDMLRGRGPVRLSALLGLLVPGGRLGCIVANGDRGDGVPYYDVVDALAPHFSTVRMFGQTPFLAYGIAEFDEASTDLRVDSDLAERESEEPTHYIALAGPDEAHELGYALVQIPTAASEIAPPAQHRTISVSSTSSANGKAPDTALAELRQKLTESEGRTEGLVRVSRAQGEEIEELRARLRRNAEARAELDEEVRRLRHAVVEADESVVNLARKTTEEITALAQRLTHGLRVGEVPASSALQVELQRRESELAERESALSERDDRIAALEAAKQEALWRADATDDELARARAELATLLDESAEKGEPARAELLATLKAQEATIEDFQRAAAVHVDEVNRLRDAANEQASLVSELEDEIRASEVRFSAAIAEAAQSQKALAESENADRVRRSRLAELEGLMLRAERASAESSEARRQEQAEVDALRGRLTACQAEASANNGRLAELEKRLAEVDERERRLAELRAEAPDPEEVYERLFDLETQYQAATIAAARVPELEAKLAELEARLAGKP